MAQKLLGFEGGTPGAASATNPPTSGPDTKLDAVIIDASGSLQVINTDGAHGSQCLSASQSTATASNAVGYWNDTCSQFSWRFYFKFPTAVPASGDQVFVRAYNSAGTRCINFGVDGTSKPIFLLGTGTKVYTGTIAIATATWYRGEITSTWGLGTATTTFEYYNLDSTTHVEPGYSTTTGNMGSGTAFGSFRVGHFSAGYTNEIRFDDLALDDAVTTPWGPATVNATIIAVPGLASAAAATPVVSGELVVVGGGPATAVASAPSPAVSGGAATITAAPTMAGTSTLAVAGSKVISSATTMAGSSSLAVTPTVARVAATTMAGSSSLAVAGTKTISSTVTMAGSSVLVVIPGGTILAAVTAAGTSTLAVAGNLVESAAIPIAGSGTFALTSPSVTHPATVTMAGAGSLAVDGTTSSGSVTVTAAVTMAGLGALGVSGNDVISSPAVMSGSGTLLVAGVKTISSVVTMAGHGGLTVIPGSGYVNATVTMAGRGYFIVLPYTPKPTTYVPSYYIEDHGDLTLGGSTKWIAVGPGVLVLTERPG